MCADLWFRFSRKYSNINTGAEFFAFMRNSSIKKAHRPRASWQAGVSDPTPGGVGYNCTALHDRCSSRVSPLHSPSSRVSCAVIVSGSGSGPRESRAVAAAAAAAAWSTDNITRELGLTLTLTGGTCALAGCAVASASARGWHKTTKTCEKVKSPDPSASPGRDENGAANVEPLAVHCERRGRWRSPWVLGTGLCELHHRQCDSRAAQPPTCWTVRRRRSFSARGRM